MKHFFLHLRSHQSVVFSALLTLLLFFPMLLTSASAATCSLDGPPAPSYQYSGSSSFLDTVRYSVYATASSATLEGDEVILVAKYYDVNKVMIGNPHRTRVFSSSGQTPVIATRSVSPNGEAITLNDLPAGACKAVYHYEVNAYVYPPNGPAISEQYTSPDYIVIDNTTVGPPAGSN